MTSNTEPQSFERRIVRRDPESVERRILDAAQAEFMQVGYDRASTNTMARAFGLSKATIFRYFPSKRHLFEAVVVRIASHWRDHMSNAVPGMTTPDGWLRAFAGSALSWLLQDEALFVGRMAISEGAAHPEIREIWSHHATTPILHTISAQLATWQSAGRIGPGPPDDLANAFLDLAVTGHVSRALYGDDDERDRAVLGRTIDRAVAIFLHGVATPGA